MSGTQVSFTRRPMTVDGTNQFEIVATCLVAGSLPDRNIFVLSMVQAEDPKSDSLLRVAAIPDFNAYLASRTDAVAEGFETWRSQSVTLRYADLTTANAAGAELTSRVNALVADQDLNLLEFETGTEGELLTFPVVDPSKKAALIADVGTTTAAIGPAEDARDAVRIACEALQTEILVLDERHVEAQSDLTTVTDTLAGLSPTSTGLVSAHAGSSTALNTVRVLNGSSMSSTSEKANIETQLVTLDGLLLTWTTQNTNLNTVIGSTLAALQATLQARIASLSSDLNTRRTSLVRCNQNLYTAQATVDGRRAERAAAVAAVLAVCPAHVF